jgi:hypothetical protein
MNAPGLALLIHWRPLGVARNGKNLKKPGASGGGSVYNSAVRRVKRETLLVVGSVAIALLIGEAATRWLLPERYRLVQTHRPHRGRDTPIEVYDPDIGYVLTTETVSSREDANDVQKDLVYSIRDGGRVTSSQPKPGPRIVTTGCSFTFGQHVTDANSWPWLLQEQLSSYHVVNVANMGYGTDQALMIADRYAMRFPGGVHTVVLGFADFQIARNRCGQSWLAKIVPFGKPQFVRNGAGVEYKRLMKFWTLGSFADSIIDESALLSRAANVVADRLVYRIGSQDVARQLTIALIQEFARRFHSQSIRFVVVVLPWEADQMPQSKLDRRVVVEQLRAAQIPVLESDFPRLPDGNLDGRQYLIGGHPNARYNALLAAQLVAFLAQLDQGESRRSAK